MPRSFTAASTKPVSAHLAADLQRLESRAFGIQDWAAGVLERYHTQRHGLAKADAQSLARLHAWIFVPLSLWPFCITDLLSQCLQHCEKAKTLSPQLRLIIALLPEVPDASVCETIAEHERQVQRGDYENVVNTQAKFAQAEMSLRLDPGFQADWQSIKAHFEVAAFQDHKGVIRRTMDAERNLRPDFSIQGQDPSASFRLAFDAFCLRWNLYGMLHDEPLLLKLAVNVTPHSTMIIIPSFWSFDAKRDMRWKAINKLHGLRVPKRQGAALAEGEAERRALAQKLHHWDAEAQKKNLKGEAKHRFLCQNLGLVEATSPRRLARLRKEFPLS